ncbi:hypothetical protein MMC27_007184 [Xylographa pallens]|nr:hypothetical protein [Xylographa pallens]
MAAPGLGIGDIVDTCNYIWRKCRDYKDAVKKFDEIASKSKSTVVVIERISDESQESGSTGGACRTRSDLAKDAKTLQALVEKYVDIHEIRMCRILFTFKEADNLADLRRRIGLHEKTLQLWYLTLMHGSLRRLENGQLDIIKAIDGIPGDMRADLIRELGRGNEKPLKLALQRSGVSRNEIKHNIEVAKSYATASPPDQVRIESRVRSRSSLGPNSQAQRNNCDHHLFGEKPCIQLLDYEYRDPSSAATSSQVYRRHSTHDPSYFYGGLPPHTNPHNRRDYRSAHSFSTYPVPLCEISIDHLYLPQSSIVTSSF